MLKRFSLIHLLLGTTLFAGLALVGRLAMSGNQASRAICLVILALGVWMLLHFMLTSFAFVVMSLRRFLFPPKAQSPFAHEVPAPRLLPTHDSSAE